MGHGFVQYRTPPNYDALKNFEWIDDYLQSIEIRKEIKFLGEKKSEIRKLQAAKEDMVARFRESWESYEKRRIEYLAHNILGKMSSASIDPFSRLMATSLHDLKMKRVTAKLDWADIEKALDIIFAEQSDETLTDQERVKRLTELDNAIDQLKAQLTEASPAGYFKIDHGEIVEDYRQTFITHWRNIQGECNAPCGPHGVELRKSPQVEQDAHARLGISSAISEMISSKSPLPQDPWDPKERAWGM